MESVFSLLSEENSQQRFGAGAELEPVKVLRYSEYDGQIVVPARFFASVGPLLAQTIPRLIDCLQRLPDASLIAQVLLCPAESASSETATAAFEAEEVPLACWLLRDGESCGVALSLPYNGVSLLADLMDCWAQALEQELPGRRYQFDLAAELQVALGETTPTFSNHSDLWKFLVCSICNEELWDAESDRSPLLRLIVLEAIADILQRKMAFSEYLSPHSAKFLLVRDRLKERSLPAICVDLLQIANAEKSMALRTSAVKLLLHLGSVEQIEKISGMKNLDFRGAAISEKLLQQIKYLACLESLDLSDTFFHSEALRHLANMPILRVLRIQRTQAQDNAIGYLSSSRSLEDLDCSYTSISEDVFSQLLAFKRLKQINLSGCAFGLEKIIQLRSNGLNVIYD